MPYCPRCETELPTTARFCVQCGAAIADPDTPESDVGQPVPDDEGSEVTDLSMPTGDATRAVEVELQACPACGASNAARRSRCGRCGARLATTGTDHREDVRDTPPTGRVAPVPPPPVSPEPASSAGPAPRPASVGPRADAGGRTRRRRAIAAVFIGGGLLVGAGIGVAAGTGLGPFASPVQVDFDAASYASEPEAVRPYRTGATSTHAPVGEHSFEPAMAVDRDRSTAWAPGEDDAEPRLLHRFEAPVWIDHVEVASGLSEDVGVSGLGRVTGARIDLRTMHVDASIEDVDGVQVIQLPEPVLVDEVTWRITRTVGGPGALSEVRYQGWPATARDIDALRGG